jgi:hypothetical protein
MTRLLTALLVASLVGLTALAQDPKEPRTGTVTGTVTARQEKWIEVKADGEEKARRYFAGNDKEALKAIHDVAVGSRVRLEWKDTGHMMVAKVEVLRPKKEEARKGTVTGLVTAKGPNWIEVKADGEEKGRRYVPHWRGGNPADGGGPDKKMVAAIKEVPLKSRVRIEWVFEERPRVEKIEVLHRGESKKDEKKADRE